MTVMEIVGVDSFMGSAFLYIYTTRVEAFNTRALIEQKLHTLVLQQRHNIQ